MLYGSVIVPLTKCVFVPKLIKPQRIFINLIFNDKNNEIYLFMK